MLGPTRTELQRVCRLLSDTAREHTSIALVDADMHELCSVSDAFPANIGPRLAEQKAKTAVWLGSALREVQSGKSGVVPPMPFGFCNADAVSGSAAVICDGMSKYGVGVYSALHNGLESDSALAWQVAQQLELLTCPVTTSVS
jgi:hypothetical protein